MCACSRLRISFAGKSIVRHVDLWHGITRDPPHMRAMLHRTIMYAYSRARRAARDFASGAHLWQHAARIRKRCVSELRTQRKSRKSASNGGRTIERASERESVWCAHAIRCKRVGGGRAGGLSSSKQSRGSCVSVCAISSVLMRLPGRWLSAQSQSAGSSCKHHTQRAIMTQLKRARPR